MVCWKAGLRDLRTKTPKPSLVNVIPRTETLRAQKKSVISQQTASYALLPQTPGTYTLPEIKLPWFNTKINRISYATIPARTLTVVPSTNPLTPTAPMVSLFPSLIKTPPGTGTNLPLDTAASAL